MESSQDGARLPAEPKDKAKQLVDLRREFVSMLFALATGQVAIMAFGVFMADVPTPGTGFPPAGWCRAAALTHLALALLVIATSWIGWSKSSSAERGVDSFFDWDFPAWIGDVLLVILYFFLVCSVEVKGSFDDRKYVFEPPSVRPEALWTFQLMIMYGVWDFLTKCLPSKSSRPVSTPKGSSTGRVWYRRLGPWLLRSVKHVIACAFASFVSITVASAVYWFVIARVQPPGRDSCNPLEAILIDLSLMSVVVFFRVMKSAEADWLRRWRLPMANPPADAEDHWLWKAAGLLLLVVICLAMCY